MKKSKAAAIVSQKCRSTWEDLEISPHHVMHIITWLEEIGMKPPFIKTGEFTGHISSMQTNEWDQEDVE